MDKRENIIEYKGHLTFTTIGRLLTQLKSRIPQYDIQLGIYKKIIAIMIEVLENIYKYSDQYHSDQYISRNYIPSFRLDRQENNYWIECINPIKNADIPPLKEKLDLINKSDSAGIKLLYRQTISNGHFTHKGGAGLGIIEMAKISGHPLEYKFEKINDNFSTYFISIHLNHS